jgi:hypothetical protein
MYRLKETLTTMYIYDPNDKKIPIGTEDYCEDVASQEEVYLEDTEEEVRMKLEADDSESLQNESPGEQREEAEEDLITGDSDDPPLSEDSVEKMLER